MFIILYNMSKFQSSHTSSLRYSLPELERVLNHVTFISLKVESRITIDHFLIYCVEDKVVSINYIR